MKKWYQSCGWVLITAVALQLSGCAKGSAYLSRVTGHKTDDQKLVEVDEKAKKKKGSTTAKKGDPVRDKAADSQLAKKSTKPKVQSSDDTTQRELASAKDSQKAKDLAKVKEATKEATKSAKKPAIDSNDPFLSEEFEALAATKAKAKKVEADATELASNVKDEATKTTDSLIEGRSKIQEVAHKVEDNLADLGDLPEWASEGKATIKKEVAKRQESVKTIATESGTELVRDVGDLRDEVKNIKLPGSTKPAAQQEAADAVELISLCPDAQGELRELITGLKENDAEGLKRGIHRIGRMGPDAKAAAPALVHLLKHKDGFVRTHSALALARMQASPPEAVQTVVDGLKSTDPGLRSFAAAVLSEMGPQAGEALSTLAESLNDRDGYVRLHAAEVLIRYDRWSYQALDALLGGLKDKDENIRWLATYSLAELAPESQETVDALLKATHDPVTKVKVGAVYALGEIGPFAKSACVELRKLADTATSQELQSAILYALQQIEQ